MRVKMIVEKWMKVHGIERENKVGGGMHVCEVLKVNADIKSR